MKRPFRESTARAIDRVVFYSLPALILLVAIPYGSPEPWWQALFQSVAFALTGLAIIEGLLRPRDQRFDYQLLLPLPALIAFAFFQTISLPGINHGAPLSADPFQTRQFIIHLLALICVAWLLVTHTTSRARVRLLVEVVIALGVVSAVFGLWRQVSQRGPGFVLPQLPSGYGYAQFINSNHFAFLMEMVLGLALGIVVCRGVTGKRLALYLMAAVPMWVALVLSNSRGGILSMLCQVLFLGILFLERGKSEGRSGPRNWLSAGRRLAIRAVLVLALLAAAIVTVVFVGGDPLAGRVQQVSVEFSPETAATYTLRQNIWSATWRLIKDHPVAGVGFGGYWIAITRYHQGSGEATPQQAHSDYLELLASGGVIGVALGGGFIFLLVRAVRRKLRTADAYSRAVTLGAAAGIIAVGVHSLVDFGLHNTLNALVFTVLVALCTANSSQ